MRKVRNLSAHGRSEPTKKEVIETIKTIEELEKHLKSLDSDEIKNSVSEYKKKVEAEREEYMLRREREKAQRKLELEDNGD